MFSSESSGPPTFWILPKLHELYESYRRNPLKTLQLKSFEHLRIMCLWICYFAPTISQRYIKYTLVHNSKHGCTVLKALSFQSSKWIFATRFAEIMQFWQDPKCRRPRTFWRKNLVFHWKKILYFNFTYIFLLVLLFIS